MGDRARFRAVAPRLELAHRQRIRELEILSRRRMAARDRVLGWERTVAHRDLQVARAGATKRAASDERYMQQRYNKLETARRALRRAKEDEQAAVAARFID